MGRIIIAIIVTIIMGYIGIIIGAMLNNEETPILLKIGSKSSSIDNCNVTDDFRTIDCDAGVVVTLTVSDEIVE